MNINNTIVVEKYNEVYFKIHCTLEQARGLKKYVSVMSPNARWDKRVKAKLWDGRISYFNMETQLLPIGLLGKLQHFAKANNYPIKYAFDWAEMTDDISEDEMKEAYSELFKNSSYHPRDYQHMCIHAAINKRRGVIEAATGSGKSLIIYSLIRYTMESTEGDILLVVPSIQLVNQMFSDFLDYGWLKAHQEVCVLHGGTVYDPSRRILISTWQSIFNKSPEFFQRFDVVVVDECHGANSKSNSIRSILDKCVNAYYRIGLTGTLPVADADRYNIFGYLGPKLANVSSDELIEKGILSKIDIYAVMARYSPEEIKQVAKMNFHEESSFIAHHPKRNSVLGYILKNINRNENSLVLCERLNHLASIEKYLKETMPDRKVVTIHGSVDSDVRETIRKDVDGEDGTIIVATFGTMSTGVNIKKIHNVFFMSSYKSKIKVLQSIGRGLRTHEDKDRVRIWDIVDDLRWKKRTGNIGKNYIFEQFEERYKYYKEQKFNVVVKNINIGTVKDVEYVRQTQGISQSNVDGSGDGGTAGSGDSLSFV